MADTVADNQRDAPVFEIDDVVPVTAHLKGPAGGLIAHRESARQMSRAEDCVLKRQGGFALLVNLVHPLQALAEAACQHGQQGLVLEGERPLLGQIDPDDQHALGMLQRDACRPGLCCIRGE